MGDALHGLESSLRCMKWRLFRTGCNKLPSFNVPGKTPAERCGSHREEGMVNVRHRVCQYEGCGTEAKYNHPGEQQVWSFIHDTTLTYSWNLLACYMILRKTSGTALWRMSAFRRGISLESPFCHKLNEHSCV